MRRVLALVVAVPLLGGPASARAEEPGRYYGKTPRADVVEVFTNDEGRVGGADVRWTARCRTFTEPAELVTGLDPLPRHADERDFAAVTQRELDSDDVTLRQAAEVKVEVAVTGQRRRVPGRPGQESWAGTVEATIEIRDREGAQRLIERCGMRRTRYRAWREGLGTGRWTMTSDPGDYIGGGVPRAFDPTNSEMAVWGDRREIQVNLSEAGQRTWRAEFFAPEGRRFERGQRFLAGTEERPVPGGAPFEITSPGRSCSDTSGEFVITAARYDRRGRLRSVAIGFTQFCDSETAALRGSLSFRASR